MSIIRANPNIVAIDSIGIKNARLAWMSRGILAYLLCNLDKQIGKEAIRSQGWENDCFIGCASNELSTYGYITLTDDPLSEDGKQLPAPQALEQPSQWGWVYLISVLGTNRYKIGYTTIAPEKHLYILSRQSPFPLETICTIEFSNPGVLENKLNQRYASERAHGEWFELSASEVQWLVSQSSLEEV